MAPGGLSSIVKTMAISGAMLAAVAAVAIARFGSVPAALAFARGERLVFEARSRDVGKVGAEQVRLVRFPYVNYSASPITIVGAKSSCTCTSAGGLPVVVPPGGRGALEVRVRPGKGAGPFSGALEVYTDAGRSTSIRLVASGEVQADEAPAPAPRGGPSS